MNNYKKSELTYYAKELNRACNKIFEAICICEKILDMDISQHILNDNDDELICEIAKRFQKQRDKDPWDCYTDLDEGDTQRVNMIVNKLDNCL